MFVQEATSPLRLPPSHSLYSGFLTQSMQSCWALRMEKTPACNPPSSRHVERSDPPFMHYPDSLTPPNPYCTLTPLWPGQPWKPCVPFTPGGPRSPCKEKRHFASRSPMSGVPSNSVSENGTQHEEDFTITKLSMPTSLVPSSWLSKNSQLYGGNRLWDASNTQGLLPDW